MRLSHFSIEFSRCSLLVLCNWFYKFQCSYPTRRRAETVCFCTFVNITRSYVFRSHVWLFEALGVWQGAVELGGWPSAGVWFCCLLPPRGMSTVLSSENRISLYPEISGRNVKQTIHQRGLILWRRWGIHSSVSLFFMVWYVIKHGGNLSFAVGNTELVNCAQFA